MKRLSNWLSNSKVLFFLIAGIIAATIIFVLDMVFFKQGNGTDVLVEAHGMLFDIILFGILLTIYENITEDRYLKQRYQDELEDFKGWISEEAGFRVAGLIKRLRQKNVIIQDFSSYNLERTELKDDELRNQDFSGSRLKKEDLEKLVSWSIPLKNGKFSRAEFEGIYLKGAVLPNVNFYRAKIKGINLENAILTDSNFRKAYIVKSNLSNTNLENSIIQEAFLTDADLSNANLDGVRIQGSKLDGADLRGASLKGATLKNASLKRTKCLESQKIDLVDANANIEDIDWY